MVMSWIFVGIVGISFTFSVFSGTTGLVSGAIASGAQAGITLAISIAGSLCLWSGVGKLMEAAGLTGWLSRLLRPITCRVFPKSKKDPVLAGHLSGNICANFLGLGNAATPMGIKAAQRLAQGQTASDDLCRLIVLNTASIQLIPATVAAVRTSLGCPTPFDILPAVWITSLCSAGLGLIAAYIFGKLWHNG
ncbi:MAG: spore maturation protein A [Ruminococcaceae bacterium]|nr:spore maturation protein A [Oscillospiraceae bacterium]MBQ3216142.1 spore maturation protein A [Oscillospiraceae bacterium]